MQSFPSVRQTLLVQPPASEAEVVPDRSVIETDQMPLLTGR